MKPLAATLAALLLAASALCSGVQAKQPVFVYRGLCDASAAIALGAEHFVVADDERNTLRVYRRGVAEPASSIDLSRFLGTDADKESDLEGAARIGDRIYWISSHGRNSKGEVQARRYRFFATEIVASAVPPSVSPSVKPTGSASDSLLRDLIDAPELRALRLVEATKRAPEAPGGLNIEGLAAADGGRLLIGLRNPLPAGKAVVVPLRNPAEVVAGKRAQFDAPLALDLGGRGIRSMERVGTGYLIVAGPPADEGSFALYRWSGRAGDAAKPMPSVDLGSLRPEALFEIPGGAVQLLSDDGGVEVGGVACKKLPQGKRGFRSLELKP